MTIAHILSLDIFLDLLNIQLRVLSNHSLLLFAPIDKPVLLRH
jgi:hypothetical protein